MAFYAIEPFGVERDDVRVAYGASGIVNALIQLFSRKPKTIPVEDFMPKFRIPSDLMSEKQRYENSEVLKGKVSWLAQIFGGKG